MEIEIDFLHHALNKEGDLKFPYLTGRTKTYSGVIPNNIQKLNHNGGLCVIEKTIWESFEGMRTKYKRSQDLDLTIGLKKKAIKIYHIPDLASRHHTIDYKNEKNVENTVDRDGFYPGLLLRDHFF